MLRAREGASPPTPSPLAMAYGHAIVIQKMYGLTNQNLLAPAMLPVAEVSVELNVALETHLSTCYTAESKIQFHCEGHSPLAPGAIHSNAQGSLKLRNIAS